MKRKLLIMALLLPLMSGCEKGFLDKKPDKALLIPTRLTELQALLDNQGIMNRTPGIGMLSSDDFYTTDAGYNGFRTSIERNGYIWAQEIPEGSALPDWNVPYQHIFYANIALEGLSALSDAEKNVPGYSPARGSALFFRAYAYYNLLQYFSAPYDREKTASLPGVPLSTSSTVRQKLRRDTQQQGYSLVLTDLEEAASLLPLNQPVKTRPDKAAALAMLARVALTMKDYDKAASYALKSLAVKNTLLDYNLLSLTATKPFPVVLPSSNDEVLFYAPLINYSYLNSALVFTNLVLYQSYNNNDLRKSLFFLNRGTNLYTFKGSYAGAISPVATFGGLTVDEVYLIAAEALVRTGKVNEGLGYLNTLLDKRWKKGTFQPLGAGNQAAALKLVLDERRKELVGRELRWQDLRRLNDDPAFQVTVQRQVNGTTYTLAPGSPRYTFAIPEEEIAAYGWEQNIR